MKRLFWLLFLTLPSVTAAQVVEVRPGSTATFSFAVSAEGEYKADLDVPKGWKVSLFEKRSTKPLQLIRIQVPKQARAGTYDVVFEAVGTKQKRIVKVPTAYEVDASFSLESEYVTAGNTAHGNLTLTNKSNVPVELSIGGDASRTVRLGVWETKTIEVQKVVKNPTSIITTVRNNTSEQQVETFSKNVRPVSVSQDASTKWHTFPVAIGMRSTYEYAGSSVQFWAEGTAPVEKGSDTVLDFLVESPSLQGLDTFSLFPNRSTYRATIRNLDYTVRLGDQFFRTSTLGGDGTSGFGLGVEREYDRLNIGWSFAGTRRVGLDRKQYHMFSSYDLTESLYLEGNFTHVNNSFVGNTFSVESGLNRDHVSALGEIGVDFGTGLSYSFEGTLENSNSYIRAVAERFSEENVSFERGSRNYEIEAGTELFDTDFSAGFFKDIDNFFSRRTFRFDFNREHFGGYYENEHSDFGTENTVGGHVNFRSGQFFLHSRARVSWNLETEERYNLEVGYGRFSSTLGYEDTRFGDEEIEVHGSYSHEFRNGTSVGGTASFRNRRNEWRESFEAHISHDVSDYSFQLTTLYQDFFRKRWGVELEASKKIGISVHKDRSVGLVFGKVIDETGNPIPNVILLIGDRAIKTGSDGKYATNLPVGKYSIRVLPQNLSVKQIVRNTSKDVRVYGAQKTHRTIRLIEGGSVEGTVLEENGSFRKGVVVELTNGEKSFRRISNEKGQFRFNGIPSGTWTVRLPLNDVELVSEKEVELESDERETVSITVKSKEEVIFLDNK